VTGHRARKALGVVALAWSLTLSGTSGLSGAEPSFRPVPVQVPEGQLGALLVPVPAVITGPEDPRGRIRIDNVSAIAERFTLSVDDYVLGPEGRPVPAPADYPYGAAGWYRFESSDLTLPPGTSVDVPFEVEVPPDAAAGDHFAALSVVVRAAESPEPGAGAAVESQLVFQIRLQHRVPGADPKPPRAALETDVGLDAVDFLASIDNDGNTVLVHQSEPFATIDLHSTLPWASGGAPERSFTLDGFYVPPFSQRLVQLRWENAPLLGMYRAVLTIPSSDGSPAVTAETSFTVVNVPMLTVLLAGIGVLMLLFAVLIRRRVRGRREAVQTSAA
jgi:hypothetical protein